MTDRVYDFLTAPAKTSAEIRRLRLLRMEKSLARLPGAIRYDSLRVQSSPVDSFLELSCDVDELDRKIFKLRRDLRDQRQAIGDLARGELPEIEARIITLRYIKRLMWHDIARAVHRSPSTVYRLHRQATDHLDAFM